MQKVFMIIMFFFREVEQDLALEKAGDIFDDDLTLRTSFPGQQNERQVYNYHIFKWKKSHFEQLG